MHRACRSCHAPPPRPGDARTLNDCAVCHGPDPGPPTLYPVLPDRAITPELVFDDTFPFAERGVLEDELLRALEDTPLRVVPPDDPFSLPVRIEVSLTAASGRMPDGSPFHTSVGRARIRVHLAELVVTGRPGVSRWPGGELEPAIENLVRAIVRALS